MALIAKTGVSVPNTPSARPSAGAITNRSDPAYSKMYGDGNNGSALPPAEKTLTERNNSFGASRTNRIIAAICAAAVNAIQRRPERHSKNQYEISATRNASPISVEIENTAAVRPRRHAATG